MTHEPQPGSFRDATDDQDLELWKARVQSLADAKQEPYESFAEGWGEIIVALKLQPGRVYYPCSNMDIVLSSLFPDAEIFYADKDERIVERLRELGLTALSVSAEVFDPGPVDLVYLLNPQIPPFVPASRVKLGGYVVCNNYHGTANEMRSLNYFELIGAVVETSGITEFVTHDLQSFWEHVVISSDEDFAYKYPERYSLCVGALKTIGYDGMQVTEAIKKGIFSRPTRREDAVLFVFQRTA